ncbi:MAG: bifunctional alpha/beta hydrolase/OsmC family protein [Acidiferrobacterales bacterium]|nr:bifunctional alpha/beta hydrolase/OsmC family protein [Acidiferrobacterales bacterium]
MKKQKIEFTGSNNDKLAGLLELPEGKPAAFALFAHCFTCGKDIASASRISRALVAKGYAVMRFDFTGLGGSDGDFENTNFSSNVEDLIAAANYLESEWLAPAILIGHSLGGTAVLRAAVDIPSSRGIVTIGSPAEADHVAKQFACEIDTIKQSGEAKVRLAGRPFTIKKQFLDDIQAQSTDHLSRLGKALLVMHSPVDTTVSINQAEKIYRAAKHPKSFVSLDQADHLLSGKADAEYVAQIIAAWSSRLIEGTEGSNSTQQAVNSGEVYVEEKNQNFTQNVVSDHHFWLADEPLTVGGNDLGPDPYEHLLAALGSCTTMTLRMYAKRKNIPLKRAAVKLRHYRQHGSDCAECDEQHPQVDVIDREITLIGDLDQSQRDKLMSIADRCPVHRTLMGKLLINTKVAEK